MNTRLSLALVVAILGWSGCLTSTNDEPAAEPTPNVSLPSAYLFNCSDGAPTCVYV